VEERVDFLGTSDLAQLKVDEHVERTPPMFARKKPPADSRPLDLIDHEMENRPRYQAVAAPGHTLVTWLCNFFWGRQMLCLSDSVLHPII